MQKLFRILLIKLKLRRLLITSRIRLLQLKDMNSLGMLDGNLEKDDIELRKIMAESIVLYGGFVTSLTEKLAWDYKTWKRLDLKIFKTELKNALGTLNESDNKVHELIEKIFKAYKEQN